MSDWAPGTTIQPTLINISFDTTGAPVHVGVGFNFVLPSGRVIATSAANWNPPAPHKAALTAAIRQLLKDVAGAEGVPNPLT